MTPIGRAYIIATLDKAAQQGKAELRRVWEDEIGEEYKRDDDIWKHKERLKTSTEGK